MRVATALRVAAIAIWVAFLVGMASWSETTPALVGAGLGTFVVGVLVGRWWVLLVVLIPGIAFAVLSAAAGTEDTGHGSGVDWALWMFLPATILIAGIMALGVLCHRLATAARPSGTAHSPLQSR